MYDVAVIGGGPAGSRVAYKLAGMGYGVVVVEQKERIGEPVCCTGIISQECVSSFGIEEGVIFRWANSAKVFSPSGGLITLWRQEPQACIVDRPAFNMALASRAQGKGVEYVLNSPVRNIEVGSDRVRIEAIRHGGGFNLLRRERQLLLLALAQKWLRDWVWVRLAILLWEVRLR